MLAHEFRLSVIHPDPIVNKVLKMYEHSLIALFTVISNKTTQLFEFD